MSEFLLVFLLAHLIGDFIFQTDKIAHLKSKGLNGLLIHCAVVTFIQVVFMSFYGFQGIISAVLVGIIHFFIDLLKNKINPYINHFQYVYFIFDQLLHFIVIYVISELFMSKLLINLDVQYFVKLCISLIVTTYISSVFVKIFLRDIFSQIRIHPFFLPHERLIDMVFGLLTFILFLFFTPIYLPVLIVLILAYAYIQTKNWSYGMISSLSKISIILVFAFLSQLITKI